MRSSDQPSARAAPPSTGTAAAIGRRACPSCNGNLEWHAQRQALACPHCGTSVPLRHDVDGPVASLRENDLNAALDKQSIPHGWGAPAREIRCQSCHAVSVLIAERAAQRCAFCNSPAIEALAETEAADIITPQGILPFKIARHHVQRLVQAWYAASGRPLHAAAAAGKLHPGDRRLVIAALLERLPGGKVAANFQKQAQTIAIHGIYVPYWTFDTKAEAPWRAQTGQYRYWTDSEGEEQQEVKWQSKPVTGVVKHNFDDVLVPATKGLPLELLRQIEPFPTGTELQPYSPDYVRGWRMERYQVGIHQASTLGRQRMMETLRRLCEQQVPGDTHRNLELFPVLREHTFKHVLAPVWVVRYSYRAREYQILVNGHNGKIAGEVPDTVRRINEGGLLAQLPARLVVALLGAFCLGTFALGLVLEQFQKCDDFSARWRAESSITERFGEEETIRFGSATVRHHDNGQAEVSGRMTLESAYQPPRSSSYTVRLQCKANGKGWQRNPQVSYEQPRR